MRADRKRAPAAVAGVLIALIFASAAHAQMMEEVAPRLKAQEARMNGYYKELLRLLDPDHRPGLIDAQRKWLAYRRAHCLWSALPAEGGSVQPALVANCDAYEDEARADELKTFLTCTEGTLDCFPEVEGRSREAKTHQGGAKAR